MPKDSDTYKPALLNFKEKSIIRVNELNKKVLLYVFSGEENILSIFLPENLKNPIRTIHLNQKGIQEFIV